MFRYRDLLRIDYGTSFVHPEDIKARVRKRGITLTDLAVSNGLEPSACRDALIRPRPKAERVIAEFIGEAPQKLWPDRYDRSGARRTRSETGTQNTTNVVKSNTRSRCRDSQKRVPVST